MNEICHKTEPAPGKEDVLATLKGLNLCRPVLLFPGLEGTQVFSLNMREVRGLTCGKEVESSADFLE